VYFRIKSLNRRGRKYADIEIRSEISGSLIAITCADHQADGRTVRLRGQVFDQIDAKAREEVFWPRPFHLSLTCNPAASSSTTTTTDLQRHYGLRLALVLNYELVHEKIKVSHQPKYTSGYAPMSGRLIWLTCRPELAPVEAPNHVIGLEVSRGARLPTKTICHRKRDEGSRVLHL